MGSENRREMRVAIRSFGKAMRRGSRQPIGLVWQLSVMSAAKGARAVVSCGSRETAMGAEVGGAHGKRMATLQHDTGAKQPREERPRLRLYMEERTDAAANAPQLEGRERDPNRVRRSRGRGLHGREDNHRKSKADVGVYFSRRSEICASWTERGHGNGEVASGAMESISNTEISAGRRQPTLLSAG